MVGLVDAQRRSRGRPWAERTVAAKPCHLCGLMFQPKAGGSKFCPTCKEPHRRAAHAKGQRAWRAKDPERHAVGKANFELKRFGMTLDGYKQKLALQGGACAVCRTTTPGGRGKTRPFAVDHSHTTGRVRDLLCLRCNGALGMVSDSVKVLEALIAYLRRHHG